MILRALLTLTLLLLTPAALGTTVLKVDTNQMTITSQWVIRAQVAETVTVDLRREGRNLVTDVTLDVMEVYKGTAVPTRYVLRLPGGTGADGVTLKIPGMPSFERGEDVVLFLEATSAGHIPCGLGQGVWRVHSSPNGDHWVRQSIGSAHLMQRNDQGHLIEAKPALHTPALRLGDLIFRIYASQPAPSIR